MRSVYGTDMFDVWLYEPRDGKTGHPEWVTGYIYCPHTKNSVYLTEDHLDKLVAMVAFDPEHMRHHVSAIWSEAIDWWRTYNDQEKRKGILATDPDRR